MMLTFVLAAASLAMSPENAPPAVQVPTFAETCAMRDAAGCTADWGTAGTQLKGRVFTNDSAALDEMFERDEGAVMCQGAAYYLHLNYLESGYRSYLVGFQSGVFSHAMTLVEVRRKDGSTALIVQDPSFNLSYVDHKGEPFSIFEIMELLSKGRHEDVIVKEGRPADVDFLWAPEDPEPTGSIYVKDLRGPSPHHPGWMAYNATISIEAFSIALEEKVRAYCEEKGVGNSLLYAVFDRPIYVYKRYPMTAEDKAEADSLFAGLAAHDRRLNPNE